MYIPLFYSFPHFASGIALNRTKKPISILLHILHSRSKSAAHSLKFFGLFVYHSSRSLLPLSPSLLSITRYVSFDNEKQNPLQKKQPNVVISVSPFFYTTFTSSLFIHRSFVRSYYYCRYALWYCSSNKTMLSRLHFTHTHTLIARFHPNKIYGNRITQNTNERTHQLISKPQDVCVATTIGSMCACCCI